MNHVYSNPRKSVTIEDWPSGSMRAVATFTIEAHATRGERAVRQTVNPKTGRLNAPKKLTYARQMVFVDGDDGRLYVLELTGSGFISVMRGTFDTQEETIFQHHEDYDGLRALFEPGWFR